jgi:hypothetical protein
MFDHYGFSKYSTLISRGEVVTEEAQPVLEFAHTHRGLAAGCRIVFFLKKP